MTLDHPERRDFPTETWAAQDIRKSDVFYYAIKHADAERARFRERGTFFFRNATETLGSMPTRTLARPVIVLLANGTLHSWFATLPDARASAPAAEKTSFGQPALFVPQRVAAVQRAKLVATVAVTLLTSAVAYLACHG